MLSSLPPPHPVKAVLAARRILISELSKSIGVNPTTLSRVLNGFIERWPALRRKVSDYLDVREESLFWQRESRVL
jgi:transcriptional regulator with XRE-family HTH domain